MCSIRPPLEIPAIHAWHDSCVDIQDMSTQTLLFILVIFLVFGGGGFYWRRR